MSEKGRTGHLQQKALLGESLVRSGIGTRITRKDQGDEFEIFSTVVLQHVLLSVFADHHVTGGYWLQFAIVEVQASAAENMVHLEITDMAMLADGTAGFEHAMVENAPLTREIFAVEQFAARICPLPPLCCMSNLVSSS